MPKKRPDQINIKDAGAARMLAWLALDDVRRKRRRYSNMTATLIDLARDEIERRKLAREQEATK